MRKQIYDALSDIVGKTRLVQYEEIPNGNKIWIKKESENPWGSHYDRVYIDLFREAEESGKIKPGDKVIETTSGSAGVSFAAIGKLLGYDCFVALPAGGEVAREKAILEHLPNKDHLIMTPAESYIAGFPQFLKKFLPTHKDFYFLNHSMGPRDKTTGLFTCNETTIKAIAPIAYETLEELSKKDIHLDYFISAIGNGSNTLGIGRVLKDGCKVIGVETFQSGAAYDLMKPGEYEKKYGIKPGELPRHKYPGTSYPGIPFPHIQSCITEKVLDDMILVSDSQMDKNYLEKTGRCDSTYLPHTDRDTLKDLHLGKTTKMTLATALDLSEKVKDKNFLVIEYDKPERYDS